MISIADVRVVAALLADYSQGADYMVLARETNSAVRILFVDCIMSENRAHEIGCFSIFVCLRKTIWVMIRHSYHEIASGHGIEIVPLNCILKGAY